MIPDFLPPVAHFLKASEWLKQNGWKIPRPVSAPRYTFAGAREEHPDIEYPTEGRHVTWVKPRSSPGGNRFDTAIHLTIHGLSTNDLLILSSREGRTVEEIFKEIRAIQVWEPPQVPKDPSAPSVSAEDLLRQLLPDGSPSVLELWQEERKRRWESLRPDVPLVGGK